MPIYEYVCGSCGNEFEEMQKITEGPKRKCPACGRLKAKRVVSQTSFVLKGSGWYATEYGGRRGAEKKESAAESAAEAAGAEAAGSEKKSESKDSGKSDSKPSSDKKKPAKQSSSKKK